MAMVAIPQLDPITPADLEWHAHCAAITERERRAAKPEPAERPEGGGCGYTTRFAEPVLCGFSRCAGCSLGRSL